MVHAGSITVAVRVRPPTSWEAARLPEPCYDTTFRGDGALSTPAKPSVTSNTYLRDIVQIVDDRILTFDPDEKDRAKAFVERGFMPPGTKRYKDRRFMFDRVFPPTVTQEGVFEATSKPLLTNLLDGYNATVFAYGATGCGKTHTISGTDTDPGIIYLTMADLFQRIEDRRTDWNVEVLVTFLEIYNEDIRDLLAEPTEGGTPRGGLNIREDKTVKVVGLTELKPTSAEEVKEIVIAGNSRRTQSPTHANETSSRSHAVLQVHVTQSPRTAKLNEQKTMGTLSIIDLAGSERAAATSNMGQRMVEGANINKSLLALGNCINALCESGGAVRHVPYRNSKLTRLLKFSLGGNCKTVMIVCVAPTSNHFDDTHNTLIYAERATKIKTKVVTRNVVNVERHVGRYVEAINRLNQEVAELKSKLAKNSNTELDILKRKRKEAQAEVEKSKNDIASKAEQTSASIVQGAVSTAKLAVANTKLAMINKRLAEIGCASGSISSSVEAEKALLKALAAPEEQAIRSDSSIATQLNRSMNAGAMFDATLRAVSERRSDKLEAIEIDAIKLDTHLARAEMERKRAEAEKTVLSGAVDDMAQVIVKLVGMLGRTTVMIGEAGKALERDGDGGASTSGPVKRLLDCMKEGNDQAFLSLVGHSTEGYVADNIDSSILNNYRPASTAFTRRISSGSAVLQRNPSSSRTSTAGKSFRDAPDASTSVGSPRRHARTPRKSLRSSIAAQPYRRVQDKKKTKTVLWKDMVDEPLAEEYSIRGSSKPIPNATSSSSSAAGPSSTSNQGPSTSIASESEWEDEAERTDDSLNLSFFSGPRTAGPPGRRARASHLTMGFLKGKNNGGRGALQSLAETEEEPAADKFPQDATSTASSSSSGTMRPVRSKNYMSPSKRLPTSMKPGAGLGSSTGAGGRRRSIVGGRRRSSLIPHLSPNYHSSANANPNESMTSNRRISSGPRRALMGMGSSSASPKRNAKRPSLSNSRSYLTSRGDTSVMRSSSMANISSNALFNTSVAGPDVSLSFSGKSGGSKPTWR